MQNLTKKKCKRSKKIEAIEIFQNGRYYYGLLFFLLLFFIMAPFFKESRVSEAFFATSLVTMLVFCILSISESKRFVTLSMIFSVPLIAKGFQPLIGSYEINTLFFSLSGAFFMLMVIYVMIHDIFQTSVVDGPIIVGSVSIYILVGLFFGFVYLSIEYFHPQSFNFISEKTVGVENISEMIYFSFITLTTLGYGDIAPISMFAKIASSIEAILGQVYLTVLVARLVGLSIVHSKNRSHF